MKAHIMDIALYEKWLRDKKFLAESSIFTYTRSLEHFLKNNPDIDDVEAYNDFLIKLTIKKRTVHHHGALKAYVEFKFEDANNLKNSIIERMVKPKVRNDTVRDRTYLTENEIVKVINALEDEKHQVIATVQAFTGARAGDVFRLKRKDIIPEVYKGKAVLRLNIIGKGGKSNVVYVHNPIIQDLIVDYMTNNVNFNGYAFIKLGEMKRRQGQKDNEFALIRMNYLWYWKDIKQALQTCQFNKDLFATHDFRRCFARRAWEKWKDIHILQKLLRHSDPKVTMKYLDQSGLQNIDYHKEMQG